MPVSNAIRTAFAEYPIWITNCFLEKYGKSYDRREEIRNSWRVKYEYTPGAEQFLIEKTKLYISALDHRNPNYTNPQFLKALVKELADYLSLYTVRGLGDNITEESKTATRKKAKQKLLQALYDNNDYIRGLRVGNNINRTVKQSSPKARRSYQHAERRERAREEYETYREICAIFKESATYRRR